MNADAELPTRPFDELYEDLGPITVTGSSEVRKVRDRVLGRPMVAKLLLPHVCEDPGQVRRFIQEARVTAQLQHNAIVPVHELARTPSGRPYFTMKILDGQPLSALVASFHAASTPDAFGVTADGWNLHRLVDLLRRASDAVAYAHEQGVLHRDIKPDNIMTTAYGEASVVDWGLAKLGIIIPGAGAPQLALQGHMTADGEIAGTAQFMAPEQALPSETDPVSPATDVYGLGATLYTLLCGVPPYTGRDWVDVWQQVAFGPPMPISARPGSQRIPADLVQICEKAMQRAPADRYPNAGAFRDQIAEWLDGVHRRAKALERVAEADRQAAEHERLLAESDALRQQAEAQLESMEPLAPVDQKRPAWALEDEAARLAHAAALVDVERQRLLTEALTILPELPEARQRLAARYRTLHERAEQDRQRDEAVRLEALIRQFDTGEHARYLARRGWLTLHTDPPGATATLFEMVEQDRRLVPVLRRTLGPTPLDRVEIGAGSWLVRLEHPDCEPVDYPVFLRRDEHWNGVPPERDAPLPIRMPLRGSLGPDDLYIPAGWAWLGAKKDTESPAAHPFQRVWIDALVMRRFPVTYGEYCEFLNALVRAGRAEEALRMNVRANGFAAPSHVSPPSSIRPDEHGVYRLCADNEGDHVLPRHPVGRVDLPRVWGYIAWLNDSTDLRWRLPHSREWEKAARGVDGRTYPWGDYFEPTWCNTNAGSNDGKRITAEVVDRFPDDCSVYGVRGMAGNVAEWCGNLMNDLRASSEDERTLSRGRLYARRGGAFNLRPTTARASHSVPASANWANDGLGFRLCRSF